MLRLVRPLVLVLALLWLVHGLHPTRLHVSHAAFHNAGALPWWIANTPLCAGPLCINIFDDHASLEWHWAG